MAHNDVDAAPARERERTRVPRSRGALSGLLLVLLGLWGALIPLIGPSFDFGFTDKTWDWSTGQFWMEILPGVVAIVGGLLLLITANRLVALFGGYLAAVAGAWFAIGPVLLPHLPNSWGIGTPLGGGTRQTWEQLTFFTALGVVIVFLAAQAAGRVTVRSVRDGVLVEDRYDRYDREQRSDRHTDRHTDRTAATVAPTTRAAKSDEESRREVRAEEADTTTRPANDRIDLTDGNGAHPDRPGTDVDQASSTRVTGR